MTEYANSVVKMAREVQAQVDQITERTAVKISGVRILEMMERRGTIGSPEYQKGWDDAVREIRYILYGRPETKKEPPTIPERTAGGEGEKDCEG